MTQQPKPCPVCTKQGKLSHEHVLPQWARNAHLAITRSGQRPETSNPAAIKMRICSECNSALGTQFENDASGVIAPMISGRNIVLTPAHQTIAAAWIIKTDLMLGILNAHSSQMSNSRYADSCRWHLAKLREGSYPLDRACVRIARFPAGHCEVAHPVKNLNFLLPGGRLPNDARKYSMQQVGYLAWQMIVYGPTRSFDARYFNSGAEHNDWFIRIQPVSSQAINWPPRCVLAREDFYRLRAAADSRRDPSMPPSRVRAHHVPWSP